MKRLLAVFISVLSLTILTVEGQAKIKEQANQKAKIQKQRIVVVKAARKFLGVRYSWGGESNYGVDCSGLTKLAYKAVNKALPHYAAAQMRLGKWVRKLKPGDLIFYYDGGHVALYIGNNRMIHASSYYGKVVNVPLRPGYTTARRLLYQ